MKIVWFEDAINDLRALREYIAADNPRSARSIVQRVLKVIELLIEQPSIGRQGKVHNTRELVITGTPYIVVYRVRHHKVEILRVFHSATKWLS